MKLGAFAILAMLVLVLVIAVVFVQLDLTSDAQSQSSDARSLDATGQVTPQAGSSHTGGNHQIQMTNTNDKYK